MGLARILSPFFLPGALFELNPGSCTATLQTPQPSMPCTPKIRLVFKHAGGSALVVEVGGGFWVIRGSLVGRLVGAGGVGCRGLEVLGLGTSRELGRFGARFHILRKIKKRQKHKVLNEQI